MSIVKHLSHSGIGLWKRNEEEWYKHYVVLHPREPSSRAMNLGSQFDLQVKNRLQSDYGMEVVSYKGQVSDEWRSEVEADCVHVMDAYEGAYSALRAEIGQGTIKFYDDGLRGTIASDRPAGDVPLFGYLDLVISTASGAETILDWKVNGYYSYASPKRGYVSSWGPGPGGQHRDCFVGADGTNIQMSIDAINCTWGEQLCLYSWMLGTGPVPGPGPQRSPTVVGIEQIVCDSRKAEGPTSPPGIRVMSYRGTVSDGFSMAYRQQVVDMWEIVNSDHIFRSLSRSESEQRCRVLDRSLSSVGLF